MRLAFIVSTIGRPDAMSALINSIGPHLKDGDVISVSVQGEYERMEAILSDAADSGIPIVNGRSQRGSSLGRNAAVTRLEGLLSPSDNPLLVFPNDTSVFDPSVIQYLRELPSDFSFGGMRLEAKGSTLPKWPSPGTTLSKSNVWAVIEPGLLIRRKQFSEIGGFDESLGTGASTPWQSGEGTDILLRIAKADPQLRFFWLPKQSAWIVSPETGAGLDSTARHRKFRAYGRGYGMILRRHSFPLLFKLKSLLGAVVTPIRYKERTIGDAMSILLGRMEGLLGKATSIGNESFQAVDR